MIVLALLQAPRVYASGGAGGWTILMNSDQWGLMKAKVAPTAIRLDTTDYVVLITAPDYGVDFISDKTKQFVHYKKEEFRSVNKRKGPRTLRSTEEIVTGKTAKLGAVTATQYFNRDKNTHRILAEVWTSKDVKIPTKLADACVELLDITEVPNGLGLPLKITKHSYDNRQQFYYLNTLKIQPSKVVSSDFKVPHGYKRVSDLFALQSAASSTSISDDDIKELIKH